ncbi:MAG TPA: HK97-gp10 family putative phage morphogenesis protein [Candidatus Acidoferrales bacterium]|jgi:HK97 gp10 family phage protein|nr:HK97-gp10 family putative phage morphogenesis protein [Candidatus Acidoferrales bacterium]
MADAITCQIKGLDELQDKLESLGKNLANKILRGSLKDAGNVIKDEMAVRAPKDTGLLSEHFNVKVSVKRDDIAASAFIGPDGSIDYPKNGKK